MICMSEGGIRSIPDTLSDGMEGLRVYKFEMNYNESYIVRLYGAKVSGRKAYYRVEP